MEEENKTTSCFCWFVWFFFLAFRQNLYNFILLMTLYPQSASILSSSETIVNTVMISNIKPLPDF